VVVLEHGKAPPHGDPFLQSIPAGVSNFFLTGLITLVQLY
jgi:hypothetical protein